VASHIAALAWMGLRHLPRRPALLATTVRRPWRRGSAAGTWRFTGRGPPRVARG